MEGIEIAINSEYKNQIEACQYITNIRPEDNKSKHEKIQHVIKSLVQDELLVVLNDFNALNGN